MIVFGHLSAPSNHGLDRRLYGLSGVRIVPRGIWVVLELEWSPRTPSTEFCRDRLTSHQPHRLIFLFVSLYGSPISILPFFLAPAGASFSPISVFPFFLASSFSFISVFPFFLAVASFLVPATDALSVFLLYFGCYECLFVMLYFDCLATSIAM